ncbi:MAG: SUMF1/EgtB/PvdO family nonheme iron enzyme, partial [Candidatus Omnitrophica bacterium]|nr:SUMF1/EgtB/PvdO family nonheme iron enzyme [Candidatus Omnitrophota bacterium]
DKMGAFVRPSSFGVNSTVAASNVNLTVDFGSCGFDSSDEVYASILGIEMVYVPEGAFYAGDNSTATASLNEGNADNDPWYIDDATAISVTDPASNGYHYVSAGNAGEDTTGASFAISSTYPKGYMPFYIMKYEITEGLWVEFLNSLPSAAARSQRDLTNGSHKNSDTVKYRNTISCSGSPLTCSTARPYRVANYLSWMDLSAFLDWAALRPMTELEFEKAARGPLLPVAGEYAWGNASITAVDELSAGEEDGTEMVETDSANVHYNNTVLTGGDAVNGADYQQGPVRTGLFADSESTRTTSGGGYYGVMELSGNVAERTVTIGNSYGRAFQGTHGDGVLSTASGYEGNATNTDWPGIDGVNSRGVTGAAGSGFRGGSWSDVGGALRISDRTNAANGTTQALTNAGGRGVRTYDDE